MTRLLVGVFFISAICFSTVVTAKGYVEVHYTYVDNIKAKFALPSGTGKVPGIVYNPDDFINWGSEKAARASGYDLEKWLRFFRQRGYAIIIPQRKRKNPHAVKGALEFLSNHPRVDKNNLYVISMGNAALTTLMAHDSPNKIKKCVLICPEPLDDTGYNSFPQLMRSTNSIKSEVLILGTINESIWRTQIQENMFKLLRKHGIKTQIKRYYYRKRWFWYPEHVFMGDIMDFLNASKNTY